MKKNILSILSIALITGCSNPPQQTSNKLTLGLVQSSVTKGANQVEITRVLGAPNIISKDKQGNETWVYDRISRERKSNSMAGFGFGAIGTWLGAGGGSRASDTSSSKSLTVIITFDDNKNVLDYAYQGLEF
jgi:outer membrane protein assembly factor BamE (lipoprotein component of BamABCDE complex)